MPKLLMRVQRLRQAYQILWKHADDASTWTINVGY